MTPRDIARGVYETPLPPAEFEARLRDVIASLDGPEGVELGEQIRWFVTRYPTPLARLAYARRKYEEAIRTQRFALASAAARRAVK